MYIRTYIRAYTQVDAYLSDSSPNADLGIGPHMGKLRFCIQYLKQIVMEGGGKRSGGFAGNSEGGGGGGGHDDENLMEKIKKLQTQLKQRDNEIVILGQF